MASAVNIYIPNKPCKRGHRLRYLSGGCVECMRMYNPERKKEILKRWKANNLERKKELDAKYRKLNPIRIKQYLKNYYNSNKERLNKLNSEWKKNNKYKVNALCKKRQTVKRKSSPPWLTEEHHKQIESIYKEAQKLTEQTGIKYHVDHEVPLQGKNVCGLHVPWNLKPIPATENISKFNHHS